MRSYWTRDLVFFVKDGEKIKIVDFAWSDYGVYPDIIPGPFPEETIKTGQYDARMATLLDLPVIKSDFVFEAGGVETNVHAKQ